MLPAERHQKILEMIQLNGSMTVAELAKETSVSIPTIRRDLLKLERLGLVSRTHGGAVSVERGTSFEPLYWHKRRVNMAEKERIAKRAASLVKEGETLMLDSGSTTFCLARELHAKRNITVITNDLLIANELGRDPRVSVLVLGGAVRAGYFSIVGGFTEEMLRQLSVDKAFLGADAVHPERGVTNATQEEVPIKRLMIQASKQAYLLADHSKFGSARLCKVADLDCFAGIITDTGIDPSMKREIELKGGRIEAV